MTMKIFIYRACVVCLACVPFTSSFCFKPNSGRMINLMQLRSTIMLLADLDQTPLEIIGGNAEVLRDGVVSSLDFVREAYIPGSWEGFVSEALANGIAGVLGSVISRGASTALGNKKKDSLTTKAATTGAFFGTRRVIRTVLRTLGLPVPLVVVLSSLVASALSSITKSILRSASHHINNGTINDEIPDSSMTMTTTSADEKLNYPEVLGDIHKWLVYDLLYKDTDFSPQSRSLMSLPYNVEAAATAPPPIVSYYQSDTAVDAADYSTLQVDDTTNSALLFLLTLMSSIPVDQTILCFIYGAIASVVGLAVIDVTNSFMDSMTPLLDDGRPHNLYSINGTTNGTNSSWGTKYAIVAVEGSLLFGCFQSIQNFLTQYIPEQYNVKFAFNVMLQGALEGQ